MKNLTDHYHALYPLAVQAEQEGSNVLILYRLEEPRPFDLSKTFGPSKSGKTTVIASTEGNQPVSPGIFVGLNVYKK